MNDSSSDQRESEPSNAALPTPRRRNRFADSQCVSVVPNLYFHVVPVSAVFRKTELEPVFPALRAAQVQPWISRLSLFAVATFQPAPKGIDMSQLSDEAQAFKDEGLTRFYRFLGMLKQALWQCVNSNRCEDLASMARNAHRVGPEVGQDHDNSLVDESAEAIDSVDGGQAWINAGDPASGLPYFTQFGERGATGYDEVGGLEAIGCTGKILVATPYGPCYLASHPVFGANMYPATLFVAGETSIVLRALQHVTDATKVAADS